MASSLLYLVTDVVQFSYFEFVFVFCPHPNLPLEGELEGGKTAKCAT
jgi:hypothetical protein